MYSVSSVVSRSCPVCASEEVTLFTEIAQVPTLCNALWTTREAALNVTRGDLRLVFCHQCGHVYNDAFEPDRIAYTQTYENSLHFSPRFQQFADELAQRLVEQYNLHEKNIIEIGCGKGDFLRSLCEKGPNAGLGFDPSYESSPSSNGSLTNLKVIQDYYSEQYAHYTADLICCRHVLEHIPQPRPFMDSVRLAIGSRAQTVVYFEVPNVLFTLRDLAIWDLIYEHCSYFSPLSLHRLFANSGFQVHQVTETFGGQYLSIEASPGATKLAPERDVLESLLQLIKTFAARYQEKVRSWHGLLEQIQAKGQRAVIWGAGSKGITLSNILGVREQIPYVVDINPRKQGMYVAGTGQRIVPPEFLRNYAPEVVIVMNALYEAEIHQTTQDLGLSPAFVMG